VADLLVSLVERTQELDSDLARSLAEEASALVDDGDVNLAALALKLCCTLISAQSSVSDCVSEKVLSEATISVRG